MSSRSVNFNTALLDFCTGLDDGPGGNTNNSVEAPSRATEEERKWLREALSNIETPGESLKKRLVALQHPSCTIADAIHALEDIEQYVEDLDLASEFSLQRGPELICALMNHTRTVRIAQLCALTIAHASQNHPKLQDHFSKIEWYKTLPKMLIARDYHERYLVNSECSEGEEQEDDDDGDEEDAATSLTPEEKFRKQVEELRGSIILAIGSLIRGHAACTAEFLHHGGMDVLQTALLSNTNNNNSTGPPATNGDGDTVFSSRTLVRILRLVQFLASNGMTTTGLVKTTCGCARGDGVGSGNNTIVQDAALSTLVAMIEKTAGNGATTATTSTTTTTLDAKSSSRCDDDDDESVKDDDDGSRRVTAKAVRAIVKERMESYLTAASAAAMRSRNSNNSSSDAAAGTGTTTELSEEHLQLMSLLDIK